jgi:hypothetical protein
MFLLTGNHLVQGFDVFISDSALGAHFVHEAGDELGYRGSHVSRFRLVKAALCVVAVALPDATTVQTNCATLS